MTVKSFTQKQLRVTFTLSNGATFSNSGSNVLAVTGLRTLVHVQASQFPAFPEAELQIFGMLQSDMNALTAITGNYSLQFLPNSVLIEANSGSGWSAVFAGQIMTAGPDYSGAPDVSLRVTAQALGFQLLSPATPTSYTGPTDIVTIVSTLCAKIGCAFENDGAQATLTDPYFSGTLADQLKTAVEHAGVGLYMEFGASKTAVPVLVVILPKGQARKVPVWTLSPQTGLIGYPSRDGRGFVAARTLYNPAYRFGGLVNLSNAGIPTGVPGQAYLNIPGNWVIYQLSHSLEANKLDSGAAWFSDIMAYPPGSLQP